MLPPTLNGLSPMVCVSAIQKSIRRAEERMAMEFAVEMVRSSKPLMSFCCNRLVVISHEDIGLGSPEVAPFVYAATETARTMWNKEKPGKSLMAIGNAIRMMCRAKKSREADHFLIVCLEASLAGYAPTVPNWVFDKHTAEGRRMGRGFEHFFNEATKLVPPGDPDPYEEEAKKVRIAKDGAPKEPSAKPTMKNMDLLLQDARGGREGETEGD